jgi:hypothetical protein
METVVSKKQNTFTKLYQITSKTKGWIKLGGQQQMLNYSFDFQNDCMQKYLRSGSGKKDSFAYLM